MLPESVNNLYRKLRSTILEFRSPAFRSYFLRKAENQFNDIALSPDEEGRVCAMKKYLEEQGELLDVLNRQTVIYNMFYDEESQI